VFASCLYHSLVKPCDLTGESPFWRDDESCFVDFATMWDQYKTHLPLILTLYPEIGGAIVRSLVRYGEESGRLPIAVLLSDSLDSFRNQARSLAAFTIADAWFRHIDGIDWNRALDAMLADLDHPANEDFRAGSRLARFTHGLDLAGAAHAASRLADGLGRTADRDRMATLATGWRRFYAEETGILGDAEYYEGTAWNYSFRLLPDMAGRMALCGGREEFVALLDRFFGFGGKVASRDFAPSDSRTLHQLYELHRFCGYNNEPDIEAPYAYLYAGRHDRTARIIRTVLRDNYAQGRGGLPGNDDSGGLSSAFVWNALGLFPVTGQPVVLIGSPSFRRASLRLGDSTLSIHAPEASEENIYIRSATLNGSPLERAWLTMDELLGRGGENTDFSGRAPSAAAAGRSADVELAFEMSPTPTDFGARNTP
jgi:putative alpha-1,2-mannosidase